MINPRFVATLICGVLLSGCSYVLMDDPPPERLWDKIPPEAYVPCKSHKGPPILDLLTATIGATAATVQIHLKAPAAEVVPNVVGAIAYALISVDGFLSANDCKRFQASRYSLTTDSVVIEE
jgi:hypothetical protein